MNEPTTTPLPATDDAVAPPRRIVLFGPASLYRNALHCLVESRVPNSDVTEVTSEQAILETDPQVILLDVDLERISESALARLTAVLRKVAPRPVLLITDGLQPAVLQGLLREGVAGVVLKSLPSETLVDAIESVSAGKVWLRLDLLAETFGESSHVRHACSEAGKVVQLTQREREIIAITSSGMTNRQIAAKMYISEATVRHHLSSIFAKLGVTNRGELIIFAYRHGLADEADRHRLC